MQSESERQVHQPVDVVKGVVTPSGVSACDIGASDDHHAQLLFPDVLLYPDLKSGSGIIRTKSRGFPDFLGAQWW